MTDFSDQHVYVQSGTSQPIVWLNNSGEPVPPFGMVEVESYDSTNLEWKIRKPTNMGMLYFCNGPIEVPNEYRGASRGFDTGPQKVRVNLLSEEVGTTIGPVAGTWYPGREGTGFQLVNDVDENYMGSIIRDTVLRHQGVMVTDMEAAENAIDSPKLACMRILKINPANGHLAVTDTVITITNRYEFVEIPAGTLVRAEFLDHEWSLYGADCGNTGLPTDTAGCPS